MSVKHNLGQWISEIDSGGMCDISDNQVIALIRGYAALEAKCAALAAELEAAEKRIAEQREYYEGVIADGSRRIAELEALEVELPKLKMLSDYLAEVTQREREDILVGVKLEFHRMLTAAGIGVKGE